MPGPKFKTEAERATYLAERQDELMVTLVGKNDSRAAMIQALRDAGYTVSKPSLVSPLSTAEQAHAYALSELVRIDHLLTCEGHEQEVIRLLIERGWEQGFGAARASEVR